MKPGDRLEWRGVNGICHGTLTESENGAMIVRTDNGKVLPLEALLGSKSLKTDGEIQKHALDL